MAKHKNESNIGKMKEEIKERCQMMAKKDVGRMRACMKRVMAEKKMEMSEEEMMMAEKEMM